jgi:hypothetical protein
VHNLLSKPFALLNKVRAMHAGFIDSSPPHLHRSNIMISVEEALDELQQITGFVAAGVAHSESGMSLGALSSGDFDVDVALATNTEVVRAKLRAIDSLELEDTIEDILITLDGQYHLIRPLEQDPEVFAYLALDKQDSNLAMARYKLESLGTDIEL